MSRSINGFTIIELLIVIVVIAILAVITVVAYNGIQARSYDSTINADYSTLAKKLELYRIDNGAFPTGATQADLRTALETIDMKLSTSSYSLTNLSGSSAVNILYIDESSGQNYAVFARSRSKKLLYFSSLSKTPQEYTGTYATNFPGVSYPNLANDIGLNGASIITYFVYSGSNFRFWN
ncbi:MAG TPA: prepilin-type N-terminal cleavage/methylation domain-containing protein [Candidatus Saccharibacteria bacterium]|nr:prepilin-type N-terminal cleavage/methylation domain-containing protein [Candidatus Saccharibacteria bacterium]